MALQRKRGRPPRKIDGSVSTPDTAYRPEETSKPESKPATAKVAKKRASRKAAKALGDLEKKKKAAAAAALQAKQDEDNVYFMRCPVSHIGLIFVHKPYGVNVGEMFPLESTNWYASYKEPDQVWPSNKINCQECQRPMRMRTLPDGGILPVGRFVSSMPANEFEKLTSGVEV